MRRVKKTQGAIDAHSRGTYYFWRSRKTLEDMTLRLRQSKTARWQSSGSTMSRERMFHAEERTYVEAQRQERASVSGRPQAVQHDWNGKCQGWWWVHTGQKARWAQMLGAL